MKLSGRKFIAEEYMVEITMALTLKLRLLTGGRYRYSELRMSNLLIQLQKILFL